MNEPEPEDGAGAVPFAGSLPPARRRHAAGGSPVTFLKARLKAASDS